MIHLAQMIKHLKISLLFLTPILAIACKPVLPPPSEPIITYEEIKETPAILPIQRKFGKLLDVPPLTIENIKLYTFIEKWLGKPYKSGGETADGIDDAAFTQLLFGKVYDDYIERTAEKQFYSEQTDEFKIRAYLKEGDLIFFMKSKAEPNVIQHVGVYLKNNQFIHSTSFKGNSNTGVKISSLETPYWNTYYLAGGRRIATEKNGG